MKIYLGEEATIGTTSVSLRGSGDDIVITVGKVEIPITFELEIDGGGGYGYASFQEMEEADAKSEWGAHIKDFAFHGITRSTMEGINILEWNEDGEEISFILRLFGDRVIMPGGWESQLGKVTIKNGDFDFEVPERE